MKYYVWFILRILGLALATDLCVNTANDVGFIVGAGQSNGGNGIWLLVLALIILVGMLAWGVRVVWIPRKPGIKQPVWRYVQTIVGVVLVLLVIVFGIMGFGNGANAGLSGNGPIAAQTLYETVGSYVVDAEINFGLLVAFLVIVTVIRISLRDGKQTNITVPKSDAPTS